jgi:GlpG protein
LREIGKLPKSADSQLIRDHLLSLGMSTHATDSADGTTIWVHNEDHLPKAREEFQAYASNPDDPRFLSAAEAASKVLKEKERLDREYRRNVRSFKGRWHSVDVRRRPLTSALAAICIGLYVTERLSPGFESSVQDWLGFFPNDVAGRTDDLAVGLRAILRGQVWRLITPIFLHVSLMHIVFNVWALVQAGTLIETRRGTATLALLVLLAALASNVGQYIYMITVDKATIPFAGISGVVYALFGYIWMKGRVTPQEGMILHPNTVRLMLGWLVLGFVWKGIRMANGSHVVGLIVGMLFGLAGF